MSFIQKARVQRKHGDSDIFCIKSEELNDFAEEIEKKIMDIHYDKEELINKIKKAVLDGSFKIFNLKVEIVK